MRQQKFTVILALIAAVLVLEVWVSTASAQARRWYQNPNEVPYVPLPENLPPQVATTAPAPITTTTTKPASTFKEGELIPNAIGTLSSDVSGYPEFKFSTSQPNTPDSILLLPSIALQELQLSNKPGRQFIVSGQVSLYQGQAYLLMNPEVDIYLPPSSANPEAPITPINPNSAAQQNPAAILQGLISHHMAEPIETVSLTPAKTVTPNLPASEGNGSKFWTAIPEGQYIWDQLGKLVHDPKTNQWLFISESDGQDMQSPPIILLPNHMLGTIQTDDADSGSETSFRVSGLVTEYNGQNYLFLTYVEVFYNLDRF